MGTQTVESQKVVRYRFAMKTRPDADWERPDDEPMAYLHGAGEVLPGVEEALDGRSVGERFEATIAADKACGARLPDDEADRVVPRGDIEFIDDLEIGDAIDAFEAGDADGEDDEVEVELWVKALDGDSVTLTLNHPFAGMALFLDLEVLDVRDASDAEIEAGCAFGWSGDEPPEDLD